MVGRRRTARRWRGAAAHRADLGLDTHPWLADHAVMGSVLLPGTAFVELAVRAGDQVGCDQVEELTLEAPLVLPEVGGVQLQLSVGAPDGSGRRGFEVYSRFEDSAADEPWLRHASGVLDGGRFGAVVRPERMAAGRCDAGCARWSV
ncbi:hypothetical protein [Streptomyces sp. Mo3]|uniref:polyketide synthase dehydratase domain-containing protein n=1 Tax=Streptomyces sp. Mo3 TaxID=3161190 RepID=UPI0039EE834B